MAHTPGPWVHRSFEPHTYGCDFVNGPNRARIAQCGDIVGKGPHGYCLSVDADEIAANARLIAAAPELLAALKAVVSVADRATVQFDQARAAIAKAEGK